MKNPLVRLSIPVALSLICLWSVGGAVWAQQEPEETPEPPLVTIDGTPITPDELDTYIDRMYSSELLLKMVKARLVWQEFRRQRLKLRTEDLERAIVEDKSDYGTEADFQAALHEKGLDSATYRRRKQFELGLQMLREKEASVPEQDLAAYYDEHKDEFAVVPRAHVRQIVLDSVAAAYAAAERAKGAEDFAAVARELSVDEETKEKGGDVGWVNAADIGNDALRERVFSVGLNEVSTPVEADGRFYVLLVSERVDGGPRPLDEVRGQIRDKLLPDFVRSEDGYVRMLMRKAKIGVASAKHAWLKEVIEDAKHVHIYVGGERLRARPLRLEDGALLVPAREVLTALQAEMEWDADTRSLTATRGEGSIELTVDAASARVNGQLGAIPQPARMVEGKLYVPPRLVGRALGAPAKYDALEYRLNIALEPDEDNE
ncbi:MAG: peptidyl-prolyl cis-trans isomerase [Armatimonadota bacterium]